MGDEWVITPGGKRVKVSPEDRQRHEEERRHRMVASFARRFSAKELADRMEHLVHLVEAGEIDLKKALHFGGQMGCLLATKVEDGEEIDRDILHRAFMVQNVMLGQALQRLGSPVMIRMMDMGAILDAIFNGGEGT